MLGLALVIIAAAATQALAQVPVLIGVVDRNPAAAYKVTVVQGYSKDELAKMSFCGEDAKRCKFAKVDVDLLLGADGVVRSCELKPSGDYKLLQPIACPVALSNFRFKPILKDGVAVEATETRRLRFVVPDTKVPISAWIEAPPPPIEKICGPGRPCERSFYVDFLIGEDGVPQDCIVAHPEVHKRLNDQICEIVFSRWRYSPATLNGKPVALRRQQRMQFLMEGGQAPSAWEVQQ
jgi:hypothetical protein